VKFKVFKEGKIVEKFELCGAYLFGSDGIAFRTLTELSFKEGVIECSKRSPEAAGLALLWPIDGFGRIHLSTTRLPERQRPYILNVELARSKLMQITTKREDWSVFEEQDELTNIVHEARDLFVESLQNIGDESKSSMLADESLKKAVVFSEQLTSKHAELLFNARRKNRGLGRHCLGCCIETEQIRKAEYVKKLLAIFGFVTIPINWAKVESREGEYDFSALDECFSALGRRKLAISAGPLLRFSEKWLPKWLLNEHAGFEKIRETAYEFVSNVVNRYAKYVHSWRVVSGLNALNHFGFSFEQILEMTRAASLAAKAADTRSLKVIEIVQLWGEYYATTPETIPPLVYADIVTQSGINFDAFGLEMCFGRNQTGMHVRDTMDISAMLDRFAAASRPVHITTVAVPDRPGKDLHDGKVAGVWHQLWNQPLQAQWVEQFCKIALSKPFINTVTYSEFADNNAGETAGYGLLDKQLRPKESYHALSRLQKLVLSR
jgi:hypothetical protein